MPKSLVDVLFPFHLRAGLGGADQKRKQEMTNFTRVKAWVLVQESDVEAKMAHCVHCCVGIVIVGVMEYVTTNCLAWSHSVFVVYHYNTPAFNTTRQEHFSHQKAKSSSRSQIPTHHLTYAAWKSKLHA
jgi:hypothetical protein